MIVIPIDSRPRRKHKKKCPACGNWYFGIRSSQFCSRLCANKFRTKKVKVYCGFCKTKFEVKPSRIEVSSSGLVFCTRSCKDKAQSVDGLEAIRPKHYGEGEANYRARAFNKYGKKCCRCGYHEYEEMLEVHHKDRNRRNWQLKNLEVLCVWCHAFETRVLSKGKYKSSRSSRVERHTFRVREIESSILSS